MWQRKGLDISFREYKEIRKKKDLHITMQMQLTKELNSFSENKEYGNI